MPRSRPAEYVSYVSSRSATTDSGLPELNALDRRHRRRKKVQAHAHAGAACRGRCCGCAGEPLPSTQSKPTPVASPAFSRTMAEICRSLQLRQVPRLNGASASGIRLPAFQGRFMNKLVAEPLALLIALTLHAQAAEPREERTASGIANAISRKARAPPRRRATPSRSTIAARWKMVRSSTVRTSAGNRRPSR